MSTLYGTSSLARMRSTRVTPNTGKPIQAPTGRTTSTSTTSSLGPAPPITAASAPTAASNISLFLTNLRLLDLDLHPDWPDINSLTFSAKDVAQGQKKRIQSVEWALYHLFALWDPEETRNKLRPFFPPLDQVQSLNLRAALLRALEQAKKNGVLGRDAVVRKTMLDECKGDRLAEVLAVFSSAVLKKMVAEQQLNTRNRSYPVPLAQNLALENRGYTGERAELAALVLVHKASLKRTLDDKNVARTRFMDFSDALKLKEQSLVLRREQVEALEQKARGSQGPQISGDRKLDIWRTVRNNWAGNERWMETLLYGDSNAHKDGLLSTPFDRVWRRVQAGRLAELQNSKSDGLLEQLDNRVKNQKERLQRWQSFRQRMLGKEGQESAAAPPKQTKHRGIDLGFKAHETLHLGRLSSKKLLRTKPGKLQGEYDDLVQNLMAELASISPSQAQVPSWFQRPQEPIQDDLETPSPEPEVISEISDLDDDPLAPYELPMHPKPVVETEKPRPTFEPTVRRTRTIHHDRPQNFNGGIQTQQEPGPSSGSRRPATVQSRNSRTATAADRRPRVEMSPPPSPERRERTEAPRTPPRSPVSTRPVIRSPPIRPAVQVPRSPERISPPLPQEDEHERSVSPTQQLADEILASVTAASPSPVKKRHTLSLAERTRLSMAASGGGRRKSGLRGAAGFTEEEDEDLDMEIDRLSVKRPPAISIHHTSSDSAGSSHASSFSKDVGGGGPTPDETTTGTRTGTDEDPLVGEVYEDLVSRTRKSMAGFEAARQKAQLERRRSLRANNNNNKSTKQSRRGSYFPSLDEEDDPYSNEQEEDHANNTLLLAEELMNGASADAVFMSRPKIKTSPVGTPVKSYGGGWD